MATRRTKSVLRSKGQFASKCGCMNHNFFTNDSSSSSVLLTKHVCRRLSFKALLDRNLITSKNKHICHECLAYSQQHFVQSFALESSFTELDITNTSSYSEPSFLENNMESMEHVEQSASPPSDYSMSENEISENNGLSLDCIIENLESLGEWSTLDKDTRSKLGKISSILGKIINPALYDDGKFVQNYFKNLNIDKSEWVKSRHPLLLKFLFMRPQKLIIMI